jgi:alkylation response protein AidB-like acyl-CoA dehydrogenase
VDLAYADETNEVAGLARRIGLDKVYPAARPAEQAGRVDDDTWRVLLDSGLTAVVAAEHGGDGFLDTVTHMIAAENFAYGDAGIALAALWSGAAAWLLSKYGSPAQKECARLLRTDVSTRGSIAIYEPFARGCGEWTTNIIIENGHVVVRGSKVAVPFATESDSIIVFGRELGTDTVHAVVVPADHPGLRFEPIYGAVALEAAPTCEVHIDATLPAEALLGAGTLLNSIDLALGVERIRLLGGAVAVGTAQRSIDYAAKYATERVAFGRPIAGFQGVSFMLAEKQMRVEAARLELAETAVDLDAGVADESLLVQLRTAVTATVNYATEVAAMTTRDAVQVLGGHGFMIDHPVEMWFRSAAALATLDFDPLYSTFAAAV